MRQHRWEEQLEGHLELVLANVLLHLMQLLDSIAAAFLDGFTVLGNGIQVALDHALHQHGSLSYPHRVHKQDAQTG